jgi:hypothetical protein
MDNQQKMGATAVAAEPLRELTSSDIQPRVFVVLPAYNEE